MTSYILANASGPLIDFGKVGRTAAFFAGAVLLVAGAKWLREYLAARRGHRLAVLVADKDNVAVAIEMASFVIAMVIGLVGSIFFVTTTWWEQAMELVGTGIIVLAVLLVNDLLTSRVILRGIDPNRATAEEGNVAVAIVRAASTIATAFVVRAALNHETPMFDRLIWVFIGQAALILLSLGYQKLTPYDDLAELKSRNIAAALPMAGILLAVGIIVDATLRGDSGGWVNDLLSFGIDFCAAAVLLFLLRWGGDKLLLPGSTFAEEIARDRNAGAGFIEAASYVSGSIIVAYFLN